MQNKIDQDEKDFLNLLKSENATANPVFKARLKEKFLQSLTPKFSIWRLLDSNLSFLAVIAVSFMTVFGGFLLVTNLSEPKVINNNPVFSEKVKQEVVEKVAQKTSISALKLLSVEDFLKEDSITKPIRSEGSNFNLRTTEVTYIPVRNIAECKELRLPSELTNTQLFEYFEGGSAIVKLAKNNTTVIVTEFNESTVEETPASFPVSFAAPISYAQPAESQTIDSDLLKINNNFEVLERTENGEISFVITDYVLFDCKNEPVSFTSLLESEQDKIIREFILNPDYSIKKVNLFLNSIGVDSKLAEITIKTELSTIDNIEAAEILK